MATASHKQDFFDTDEGIEIRGLLEALQANDDHATQAIYSPNTVKYENNLIPFVEKHIAYIRSHPQVNPAQYLANLRLLTRKK